MSKSPKKSAAKKSAKKSKPAAAKKANPLHEKLVRLFTRASGATVHDTMEAGFKAPAIAALRIVERKGYKVSSKKVPGQLTSYFAKRSS